MTFSYHRAVAPMMWIFVAVAGVELVVTHLLVALWRPGVALTLSAMTVPGVIWLIGAIRSFRRLPVLIEADRLVLRTGTLMRVDVPRAQVAGLRESWHGRTSKARGARKLSLLAHPNVVVAIDPPVAGRRGPIRLVGHRLDDPGAFAAQLSDWLARPST